MSKDTITVNMNVYDIPIVVEQLNKLQQENKQLKDKLEFYSGLELDKTIDKTRLEYNKLQQENKKLKIQISAREEVCNRLESNWNMLKEHLKNRYDNGTESISYRQVFMEIREAMQVLEIAQELEQGSDSNE